MQSVWLIESVHLSRKRPAKKGEKWTRYIRAVIPITTWNENYVPYVLLTSKKEVGEITGFQFAYFVDLRCSGGKLKHGHGPGGVPVFDKDELFQLLEKLVAYGCLSKQELTNFIEKIKKLQ